MATYTTNGGIKKIATGDESGTWGTSTNTNFDIIDRLAVGVGDITLSGTTHTLTTSDGAASDGQYHVLVLGGSPSGTNTITVSPNDTARMYVVKNNSGQTATFTQGTGSNVSVNDGKSAIIYCDGAGSTAAVVDVTSTFIGTTTLSELGVTATAAELNYNDITTLGAVEASKTVTADASGNVNWGDNEYARFGASNDLVIYHDGSNSMIQDNGTGNLNIRADDFNVLNTAGTETKISAASNGATRLYYDNSQRFTTTSTGADVTGDGSSEAILRVDTNSNDKGDYRIRVEDGASYGTMFIEDYAGASWTPNLGLQSNGEVYFYEDTGSAVKFYWDSVNERTLYKNGVKAVFGDAADGLEIYHDGFNSYVDDTGTGDLYIRGSSNVRITDTDSNKMILCQDGGEVQLYYNGNEKLNTTNVGVDITGVALTDGITVNGTTAIEEVIEKVGGGTSTSGTINYNLRDGAIQNFTANQTANRTVNFRASSSETLNAMLATGESITCTLIMAQGSTAYYLNAYQVDGTSVTPEWSGGEAPTEGNASSLDVYTFTIIKTASATYTVLASQTQYA